MLELEWTQKALVPADEDTATSPDRHILSPFASTVCLSRTTFSGRLECDNLPSVPTALGAIAERKLMRPHVPHYATGGQMLSDGLLHTRLVEPGPVVSSDPRIDEQAKTRLARAYC